MSGPMYMYVSLCATCFCETVYVCMTLYMSVLVCLWVCIFLYVCESVSVHLLKSVCESLRESLLCVSERGGEYIGDLFVCVSECVCL